MSAASATSDPPPVAGPSRPSPACIICSSPSKYTCPRCALRTCSLPCSRTHKERDACSGVRDPAKFVPLKEYGQGVWSDDYRWLEEGRRKAAGWGEGVKVEEVNPGGTTRGRGRGRGGRGGGSRGEVNTRSGRGGSKMDGLRRELEKKGCKVELMPEGMGRKKLNQSSWNPKTQQLYLTLHFSIPGPLLDPPLASGTSKSHVHPRALFAAPAPASLPTLASLLPKISHPTADLTFLLPFHSTLSRPAPPHQPGQKLFYPPLDGALTLEEVLRGTAVVEFPVVQVMLLAEWEAALEKGEVGVVGLEDVAPGPARARDSGWGARGAKREAEDAQPPANGVEVKKAKVEPAQGLVALGQYDSEEESDAEGGTGDVPGDTGDEAVNEEWEVLEDEDEDEGEDPSPEVLQAVGMALIADLGEAEP
ncbi:hypothetical protein IAT38_007482 [Cryptococcus sp. DSM 104549]